MNPLLLRVLAAADAWRPANAIAHALGGIDERALVEALDALVDASVLDRSDRSVRVPGRAWKTWDAWSPTAAFFHFGVRNTTFAVPEIADARQRARAKISPPPPPLKATASNGTPVRLALPKTTPITPTLLARRTFRRFGGGAVRAEDLGTLLAHTWGVQQWIQSGARTTRAALKTAPSGGARHSIEAYLVARRVSSLAPALYHYDPEGHALRRLRDLPARFRFSDYMPHQHWYDGAAALVVMSAVFPRAQWRYADPRSYRSVLYEAGHHAQNFLLLATALGLAPFCTGALADSRVETDLGIDGVTESVLYACGVGVRPAGVAWAPWPDEVRPKLFLPRWKRPKR